jgi:hypothetical protein
VSHKNAAEFRRARYLLVDFDGMVIVLGPALANANGDKLASRSEMRMAARLIPEEAFRGFSESDCETVAAQAGVGKVNLLLGFAALFAHKLVRHDSTPCLIPLNARVAPSHATHCQISSHADTLHGERWRCRVRHKSRPLIDQPKVAAISRVVRGVWVCRINSDACQVPRDAHGATPLVPFRAVSAHCADSVFSAAHSFSASACSLLA